MKELSEQLKQDHESGDFGKALEGYAERAKVLEVALQFYEDHMKLGHEITDTGRRATVALRASIV